MHIEKPEIEEISEISKKFQLPSDYLTAILDDAENSRAEGLEQETFCDRFFCCCNFPMFRQVPAGICNLRPSPFVNHYARQKIDQRIKLPPNIFQQTDPTTFTQQ